MKHNVIGLMVLASVGLTACGTTSAPLSDASATKPAATQTADKPAAPDSVSKPLEEGGAQGQSLDALALAQQINRQCGGVVYFDFDSYSVPETATPLVQCHAEALLQHGALQLQLLGHTDELGSQEYNTALGDRRAQAVLKLLRHQGVDGERLEAISMGELSPVATGHDEAAHRQNRRVEFVYQGR